MRLGLMLGYWGPTYDDPLDLVLEAERLGYDSVWTAEAYGSDVFTPLAWIGARTSRIKLGTGIAQISARTPACLAMTAMTLDQLSGGRVILGIGVSGPQVVEGWYGQDFRRPLTRTREAIEILRAIWRREGPLTYDGRYYKLPTDQGAGLGKPLKLITYPLRPSIPIYLGAEGPKNVQLAFDVADGWLPLFFSPYRTDMYRDALAKTRPGFEIGCTVTVVVNDDLEQAMLPVKWTMAFYIGGMGHPDMHFHVNAFDRMGFGEPAARVRKLFLEGKRAEAAAAVPDALCDELALVGSPARIKDRLAAWKASPVTTILVGSRDPAAVRLLAEALL